MNMLKEVIIWMISPFYFTYQFLKYFIVDVYDSLKTNLRDEYVWAYKDLYKKLKRVRKGEVDWMGNRLKEPFDKGEPYKRSERDE